MNNTEFENLIELGKNQYFNPSADPENLGAELYDELKKNGLNIYEIAVLFSYTGSNFKNCNTQLRNKEFTTDFIKDYSKHLNNTLEKLPKCSNKKIWRCFSEDIKAIPFLKKYIGRIIEVPYFMSASYNPNYLHPDMTFYSEITTLNKSNGVKNIVTDTEFEIIFKTNSKFLLEEIEKRIKFGKEYDTLILREVKKENSDVILTNQYWLNI